MCLRFRIVIGQEMRIRLVRAPAKKGLRTIHQVAGYRRGQSPAETAAHTAEASFSELVFFPDPARAHQRVLANWNFESITIGKLEDSVGGFLGVEGAGFHCF